MDGLSWFVRGLNIKRSVSNTCGKYFFIFTIPPRKQIHNLFQQNPCICLAFHRNVVILRKGFFTLSRVPQYALLFQLFDAICFANKNSYFGLFVLSAFSVFDKPLIASLSCRCSSSHHIMRWLLLDVRVYPAVTPERCHRTLSHPTRNG